MGNDLTDRKILFMTANEGVEQVELTRPWQAVIDAGGQPILAAIEDGEVQAYEHLDKAELFPVHVTTSSLEVDDYDALVLPGGVVNPDQLRMDSHAVGFIRNFVAAGKPVAAICHGPWTLIEADAVDGRRLTSWPSLQTDIRNAGGDWTDEPVVECEEGPNVLVTSRKPDDLDAFCETLVRVVARESVAAG
jgi:protease I